MTCASYGDKKCPHGHYSKLTAQSWEEVLRELERNGKVYVAAVFINNDLRLRDMLDNANKKIAALERRVAQLTAG